MQIWKPIGRIIKSQAQLPTVLKLPDCWRIYYSRRDLDNKSVPFCIDVEIGNPTNILSEHSISLPHGPAGSFDHYGVMPSCAIKVDGDIYLYYVGWSIRQDVPYHNMTGLAVSRDGLNFTKIGPVVATNLYNQYFTGTAHVIKDGEIYRMFHMSCTGWSDREPKYHLKQATSNDAVHWKHHNIAVDYNDQKEAGISSASVYKSGVYYMWYSTRQLEGYRRDADAAYRIGCATSLDGDSWTRCDQTISLPRSDWDNIMQCYPEVIRHGNRLWMFYNGNGFGKTGIGVACLSLL